MYIKTSSQERLVLGIGNYECNWGMHIAGLYETPQERDAIINGYACHGQQVGDLVLYAPNEQTGDEFKQKMRHTCPACADALENPDAFSILSPKELYYPNGTFDPWEMDKALDDYFAVSQQNGKRNVRAIAEMSWALGTVPGKEHLMAYEARLNFFIPGKPWISICLYDVNAFPGNTIMQVLRTHPFTLTGGILTQNPYFVDPAQWLAKYFPQFLKV